MKLKAAITDGAPEELFAAFGSPEFATGFLAKVVSGVFEAEDPFSRPAEYYVQLPDRTVGVADALGVEIRLTGVSRGNRDAELFHEAFYQLCKLVYQTIENTLDSIPAGDNLRVQTFIVMMIDGDIPGPPGSGSFGPVYESKAVWVTASGIETE